MTPSGCDCGRIISGSMCPEATVRTASNSELHILYISPRKDPSSWAGSTASTASPRVRTLDSLCSDLNTLQNPRRTMLLRTSCTLGTPSAARRDEWWVWGARPRGALIWHQGIRFRQGPLFDNNRQRNSISAGSSTLQHCQNWTSVVDWMTQVELWCIMSFKCALVEKDRPVSKLRWGWRNHMRCGEMKWKGVYSAYKNGV